MLRTLGTLTESLPKDTIPSLAVSMDENDALNLPSVLNCLTLPMVVFQFKMGKLTNDEIK